MTIYYIPNNGFLDDEIHAAIPSGAIAVTESERMSLLAGLASRKRIVLNAEGRPTLAERLPPSAGELLAQLTATVQSHLDAAAQAAGYDSIYTAVSYADEPAVPKFQAEGQAFRAWRSFVWDAANSIRSAVEAGTRAVPTAEQLIAELPALSLPA